MNFSVRKRLNEKSVRVFFFKRNFFYKFSSSYNMIKDEIAEAGIVAGAGNKFSINSI